MPKATKSPSKIASIKKSAQTEPVREAESFEGLEDAIRQRAYELFEQRGRGEGSEEEDWLQAEAEVMEEIRRKRSA